MGVIVTILQDKTAIREMAKARRAEAQATVDPGPAWAALRDVLAGFAGKTVAGYSAIGSEIDPAPALVALAETHRLCLPVTHGRERPLSFHLWTPGEDLQAAGFGTAAPVSGEEVTPDVLVVPLLAFDRAGGRLGYGAGHYDRSLAGLRARAPVAAYGFAYGAQEFEGLPQEPTDQPLDGVITEAGLIPMPRAV